MRTKITAFISNATCVFREMKMLDADNQVDLSSMKERVAKMPVDAALKKDLDLSLDACHQFAGCLPEYFFEKPAVSMGFGRQMVFFKCFKVRMAQCHKDGGLTT